jgi:hypothetical protein
MTRRSSGRGYLQQLAQPVVPGATVLTARPISATYAPEAAPVVPVIEDHFNMPDDARTAPARDSARARWPMDQTRSTIEYTGVAENRYATAEPSANVSPRTVKYSLNLPLANAEPEAITAGPAEAPSTRASSRHVPSALEERSVDQPVRAETQRGVQDRKENETPRLVQSLGNEEPPLDKHTARARTEQPGTLPPVHEPAQEPFASLSAGKDAPPSQAARQDYFKDHAEIQRTNEAAAPMSSQPTARKSADKSEVRTSEGPRVHIGTVEIRAVLPQPAIPQPVPMAQNLAQNSVATQARGRSGAAEPLARGLDWSYGLVQG